MRLIPLKIILVLTNLVMVTHGRSFGTPSRKFTTTTEEIQPPFESPSFGIPRSRMTPTEEIPFETTPSVYRRFGTDAITDIEIMRTKPKITPFEVVPTPSIIPRSSGHPRSKLAYSTHSPPLSGTNPPPDVISGNLDTFSFGSNSRDTYSFLSQLRDYGYKLQIKLKNFSWELNEFVQGLIGNFENVDAKIANLQRIQNEMMENPRGRGGPLIPTRGKMRFENVSG